MGKGYVTGSRRRLTVLLIKAKETTINVIVGLMAVTLVVSAGWAIVLFAQDALEFQESTLSNYLSTIAGVIAGIPVALWLSSLQQRQQEGKDRHAKEIEHRERKRRILVLLEEELQYNKTMLLTRAEAEKRQEAVSPFLGMKNDLWITFSTSGELEWIDDVQLLNCMSLAYYHTRLIINLEQFVYDPNFYDDVVEVTPTNHRRTIRGIRVLESLRSQEPLTLKTIDDALLYVRTAIAVASR